VHTRRIGIDYRAVTSAPYSGIGRQVRGLTEALAADGRWEIFLFSDGGESETRWPVIQPNPVSNRVRIHRPHMRLWFEHGFLPDVIARQDIEVFVTTANCGVPAPLRTPLRRILWVHDFFPYTIPMLYRSLRERILYGPYFRYSGRLALRLADEILTPSNYNVMECRRLFGNFGDKMRVLPNFVPGFPEVSFGRIGKELPKRYWLVVGTTGPRKNIASFVDAWLDCGSTMPDLVMVGNTDDFTESQLRACGERLRVLSCLNDAELGFVYRHADRLWHPSHAEGFGLPPLEAMSLGTPVAVAQGTALDEVVPKTARRFPPNDGSVLRRLMIELAEMPRKNDPDPELVAWASNFGPSAFNARVSELSAQW